MRYFKIVLSVLIFASLLSLLPNLSEFHLHKEEVRRTLIAFEMDHRDDFFQPTVLGEPYFNKPPLFNWLIVISSKVLGWETITPRAVTLTFTVLTALAVFLFARRVLGGTEAALLSSAIFLTFADVLFWYGWMAEIEMTLTFLVSVMIFSLYLFFETGRHFYLLISGLLCGLGFSLKGFPSLAFFGLSLITLTVIYRRPSVLTNRFTLISYALAFTVGLWWLPLSDDPVTYITTLWRETFSRVEASRDLKDTLKHLITYPLLNLKQTLPAGVLGTLLILRHRTLPDRKMMPLIVVVAVNYVPYLISPEARGRYVLPLFPVLAVVLGDLFLKRKDLPIFRLLVLFMVLSVVLRVAYGYLAMPEIEERRGDPEKVAEAILELSEGKDLACGCGELWDVCLYAGMKRGEPLYSPEITDNWEILVDCRERNLKLVNAFSLGKRRVYVYSRYNLPDEDIRKREDLHTRTGGDTRQGKGDLRKTDHTPQDPGVQRGLP